MKDAVATADARAEEEPRRLERPVDRAWIGGVCEGLGDHLGMSPVVFRAVFVVLAAWQFLGVVAYVLLWLVIPRAREAPDAPGLDAARRRGLRAAASPAKRGADVGQAIALALFGLGLIWIVQAFGWGLSPTSLAAGALGGVGIGLAWRAADQAGPVRLDGRQRWGRWFTPLVAHWTTAAAIVTGMVCLAIAIGLMISALPQLGVAASMVVAVAASLATLALLAAPWVVRGRSTLARAREEKLLSDARADMAAHLHDSVLQTLALIQRQAEDPREVVRLARRQERELRQWLYGGTEEHATLRAALVEAAQDVEDDFPVAVECVVVGDTAVTVALGELVRAAREAMVNAAKHSGSTVVDVYAEVGDETVEVFVRDRGRGFDPDAIAEDRLGVRRSIVDRMRRHHGTARIRSDPERGTEVMLEMRP